MNWYTGMTWYTAKLDHIGITERTPRRALEQALLIGAGNVIEDTMMICLAGIREHLHSQGRGPTEVTALVNSVWNSDEFLTARHRLKLIKHEAI